MRYVRLVRAEPAKLKPLLASFATDAKAAGITHVGEGETLDHFVERAGKLPR